MDTPKQFQIGNYVEWSSQAHGSFKKKVGGIVEVVRAGQRPNRDLFPDLYSGPGAGFGRKHESYVVAVKKPRSTKHYWPNASKLRLCGSQPLDV
jgi:hypothetical protein